MACIFCKIALKEVPTKAVFEDPELVVIEDINPQAPVHMLVIPRIHMPSVLDAQFPHMGLLGKMILVAKDLAVKYNLQDGFRMVLNTGVRAGQTVPHIHLHVLAGRQMNWPPG